MSKFLQSLVSCNAISIKQKFEVFELFGFETRNRYRIYNEYSQEIGYCAEAKLGFGDAILRQFLGHWRTFDIIGTDTLQQKVFRAHHPFRWFFNRLDIYGAGDRPVGSLQQNFAWFNKEFDFLDTQNRVVMTMSSPFWRFWHFPVTKAGRNVSLIQKKWSGLGKELFTDADNFKITFIDQSLTSDQKLLLLAGAIFIDILYFETKAGSQYG
ncbi:Scramblase [Synechococcus sp. PCC 7502]|uniref:scramblase n=1 Tax=Synechococcus sp. PCC 7502 TaxID=1173263 RepID=UPI00029F8FA3|nr:scramblase [Synechococcus sp. PCC 7502]AFY73187.1 Scramblase [Synechococcus sp. PCC 7502]